MAESDPKEKFISLTWCRESGPTNRPSYFGARGNLHLERRALAYRGLDPDTTTMHLHDLLGDGEAQTGAALGLGVRAIDLMKLVKDARLMFRGNAGSSVRHGDGKVTIDSLGGHSHLACIREFNGVAHEVEKHLRQALLVAEANWQRLGHLGLKCQLLVLGERLGGRAHRTPDRTRQHLR